MSPNSRQAVRSAAITGAGGGLGRDIALGLAEKGYAVFGTAMTEGEIQDLKSASGGRVSLAVCDITKEPSVKALARSVSVALGDGRGLDVLISNAGILTPGPLEVLSLDAIRREFDVNVFGALSVMTAFLPALRKARGRIVQVSTWTARLPLPFNGPSGASKAAMDVLATVYRAELSRFGVEVVIAAAGNMRTGGPAKTAAALSHVLNGMSAEQRELYGQTFGAFADSLNAMQGSGLDSRTAAREVIELAEQMPAPSVAPVGADAEDILRVVREKSFAEQDALRLQLVGLGDGRFAVSLPRPGARQIVRYQRPPGDARKPCCGRAPPIQTRAGVPLPALAEARVARLLVVQRSHRVTLDVVDRRGSSPSLGRTVRAARAAALTGLSLAAPSRSFAQEHVALPQGDLGQSSFLDGTGGPGLLTHVAASLDDAQRFTGPDGQTIPGNNSLVAFVVAAHVAYLVPIKVLGGYVGLELIVPVVPYLRVQSPGGTATTSGAGDLTFGPLVFQLPDLTLLGRPFSSRFSVDITAPTGRYGSAALVNVGNHVWSVDPYYAFTWLLTDKLETSLRLHYSWSSTNGDPGPGYEATTIQPGQSFHLNTGASYQVVPPVRAGVAGYFLQQTTDARANGGPVAGSRERVAALGPGLMAIFAGAQILATAYWELAAENRPTGSVFLLSVLKPW